MSLKDLINQRRAYRSLSPVKITEEMINDLASCAQLSPSCFNNQPWNYIFIQSEDNLLKMREALSKANQWAYMASLIIVIMAKREDDCIIKGRDYYLFDTGMATTYIILRATELNLVAHPIAGFDEDKVKEILSIDPDFQVITLIIVGKKADTISDVLNEKQLESEKERPERKPLNEFIKIV